MAHGGGVGSGDTEVGKMAITDNGGLTGDANASVCGALAGGVSGLQLTVRTNVRNINITANGGCYHLTAMGHLLALRRPIATAHKRRAKQSTTIIYPHLSIE